MRERLFKTRSFSFIIHHSFSIATLSSLSLLPSTVRGCPGLMMYRAYIDTQRENDDRDFKNEPGCGPRLMVQIEARGAVREMFLRAA